MKKSIHLVLLCIYVLFANAASIIPEAQEDADSLGTMESESRTENNVPREEPSFVADTLNQIQNNADSPSIGQGGHREPEPNRGHGDLVAKTSALKTAPTEKPSYFNPFDDYKEASPFIFTQHEPDHKAGLSPLRASKEFISSIEFIDDPIAVDETLREVVDHTVTMALQINDAWNTLDEKVTHIVYKGISQLRFNPPGFIQIGYSGQSSNESADDSKPKFSDPFADPLVQQSVSQLNTEPDGFFAYFLFHLPKMMTLSSLFIILGVLFVMNLVYRIMRFFFLRI